MYKVLLLGAGKIGNAVARLLTESANYDLLVCDIDENALSRLEQAVGIKTLALDSSNRKELLAAMAGQRSVISALSFALNPDVARAALESGLSYFDLTEDIATSRIVKDMARSARSGQIFMPQCGLAPGFVSIAANHLCQDFDRLDSIHLRVGALPLFPTNEMKYNLTWSTEGLINEYGNLCEAIHEGKRLHVLPLEGLEHFSIDGVDYEAFNTSGGVGTLCDSFAGKVRSLDYKTIRYRGHCQLMTFLLHELRLGSRRKVLKNILEDAIPTTAQDVVLIFCTVTGWKRGYLTEVTDARKIYHGELLGDACSAISRTTAASLCAALDLHATGKLPDHGFVRQEQVRLSDFLSNRFGQIYDSRHASCEKFLQQEEVSLPP